MSVVSRREWLARATAGSLAWPMSLEAVAADAPSNGYRMGIVADLHHGLAPTAIERLQAFVDEVEQRRPDSILQLGDFNYGDADSEECMNVWGSFSGPKYHVPALDWTPFPARSNVTEQRGHRSGSAPFSSPYANRAVPSRASHRQTRCDNFAARGNTITRTDRKRASR